MKKRLPLILSMVVGVMAIAVFYIPAAVASDIEDTMVKWAAVLAATAYILGGINIVQVNYPKIRRRERDWQFKVLLLGSAAVMLLAGIPWHKLSKPAIDMSSVAAATTGSPNVGVEVGTDIDRELLATDKARLVVSARGDTLVSVDGGKQVPGSVGGTPAAITVAPGKHTVVVTAGTSDFFIGGYSTLERRFEVAAGQTARTEVELQMKWGLTGRAFKWLYDHIFDPCNSTMFALLAFFIASAAFRAFRARNVEAALLLGAAILVMLGRVPIGGLLSDSFPYIADWLVDVPNNAGRRAIMMGAALGAVATGLRVILGLERSHLGSD